MSQLFTSQDEFKEFAACLSVTHEHKDLRTKIKNLPQHLRYSKKELILHKTGYRGNDRYINMNRPSCSAHKWIDSIVVSAIFDSLRTELAKAVEYLNVKDYINHAFGPDEYVTLYRVAAIQEMWTMPWPDANYDDRWGYQDDQCEACMLSRIATDPSALRELRTIFLTHPTRKLYQPIILMFVDEWIKLTDQWKSLFEISNDRAKEIEKCIKHWSIHKGEQVEEEENANQQQLQNVEGLERLPVRSYQPTSSLTQDMPNPLFSATVTRPLSRNEYELSEAEFLQEFSPKMTFYRTSSNEDDDSSSSSITDINSQDNDTTSLGLGKTISVLQKQQIMQQYRDGGGTPDTVLSSRLYSPWSSTDEIREFSSRFSQTTVSSPSYSVRHEYTSSPISPPLNKDPKTPYRYRMPVSPPLTNPKTPDSRWISPPPKTPKTPDRNRMLLTIPEVSPFHVSPFVPASSRDLRPSSSRGYASAESPAYSPGSAWSSGQEEVVKSRVAMRREQPRVVHVRAARDRGRYTPK